MNDLQAAPLAHDCTLILTKESDSEDGDRIFLLIILSTSICSLGHTL
jgi:hypothetical protein